jgi:hypothetical protein
VFTSSDGTHRVELSPPSNSEPFFAGAGDSFNAANNTPKAIIVRNLTAAFATGILPVDTGSHVLSKAYFEAKKETFYKPNANLTACGPWTGPWYDLYSKALHSLGHNIYTFAYDDVLGIDGTATSHLSESPHAYITLGDLSGTHIPDPYTDPSFYTITVHVASSNPVTHQGKILTSGQKLENVSMPFSVQFRGIDGRQHTANIYVKHPLVRPSFNGAEGVVIQKTGKHSATIIFPG